ncbi:MAG: hypothetical protein ABIK92_04070 [Pseudomonadota bacterium]
MRLLITVIMSAFLLVGCNAVSDMKGMFEKQGLVQEAIKAKYGLQSQVGWNIHNGVLTQVTVIFDAEQVRDKKVSELEIAAREAVESSFKSKPQVLNVQIACKTKEAT